MFIKFWIIGNVELLELIYSLFKEYEKNNEMEEVLGYLYVFSVLGMIEVTINITFIVLLEMINNEETNSVVRAENEK